MSKNLTNKPIEGIEDYDELDNILDGNEDEFEELSEVLEDDKDIIEE